MATATGRKAGAGLSDGGRAGAHPVRLCAGALPEQREEPTVTGCYVIRTRKPSTASSIPGPERPPPAARRHPTGAAAAGTLREQAAITQAARSNYRANDRRSKWATARVFRRNFRRPRRLRRTRLVSETNRPERYRTSQSCHSSGVQTRYSPIDVTMIPVACWQVRQGPESSMTISLVHSATIWELRQADFAMSQELIPRNPDRSRCVRYHWIQ